ncbi:hypothetical protein BPOR_0675g00040 [Botrytis porri]|uniref:Uncharacterized protein n=1 Tax=Botrytis porri TaxID=87229 RepID=A0A4Z1KPQ5_9HELO|nr:hypothetical protein BPOR_0675g00040 [Botrytis porri]
MTERSNTRPVPYIVATADKESKLIRLINQKSYEPANGGRSSQYHAEDNDAARHGESMAQ